MRALKKVVPSRFRQPIVDLKDRSRIWANRTVRQIVGSPARHGGVVSSLPITRFAAGGENTFFGYFDKTPFSADNSRLLASATGLDRISPGPTDALAVGFFDVEKPTRFHRIGATTTWCWQQGCMLQWFPADANELVLYNRPSKRGEHASVIQNVQTGTVEAAFERPIYCLNASGRAGISLNFARLHRFRPGYGYAGQADPFESNRCPEDDGIWRVDLRTGDTVLLHSLHELAAIEPQPSMAGAWHYLNHATFNPSGDRFVIFHLWVQGTRRFIRMFTCNQDGGDLFLLTNESMVSHFDWSSDAQLLAFAEHSDHGRHFYRYEDRTDRRAVVGPDVLQIDGHPAYSPRRDRLLCDTYPDRFGEQTLFQLNERWERRDLATFRAPGRYRHEFRCDLHPRWDRTGRIACVDSAHSGRRAIYTVDTTGLD